MYVVKWITAFDANTFASKSKRERTEFNYTFIHILYRSIATVETSSVEFNFGQSLFGLALERHAAHSYGAHSYARTAAAGHTGAVLGGDGALDSAAGAARQPQQWQWQWPWAWPWHPQSLV